MTLPGGGSKPKILCVEDQCQLLRDISEELVEAGYDALAAKDGRAALALLEEKRPDLILCDIFMPRLDGYGLLEAVRHRYVDLADVPFVFLTALNQPGQVINGKRAGADDYLVKPIDYDLMLATIGARLQQVNRIRKKEGEKLSALRLAMADHTSGGNARIKGVLDMLSFGIVVVSSSGVMFANRAARSIHEAEDGLIIDRRLRTTFLADALRSLLADACAAAREGGNYVSSLSVPRPSGQRDFLITACALPCAPGVTADDAQAVVFICNPEHRPALPRRILSDLFGLTPTEAEVAGALAQGQRTDEIAQNLSIATTTVAFHLRNLFWKTGTHRQADLIVLLLTGLASIGNQLTTDTEDRQ